jgi:asparagine synthase (glutamine-hydrolysing)
MNQIATILCDFVLAGGIEAAAWLRQLQGFEHRSAAGDTLVLATRGEACQGMAPSGMRWLALADLVGGLREAAAVEAAEGDPAGTVRNWRGRFVHVAWHPSGDRILATTDHFSSIPLYWYRRGGNFAIATDPRLLLDAPGVRRDVDPEAIYHYLNFGYIPAPTTICRDIRRIEPGTRLALDAGGERATRYYVPSYPTDLRGDDDTLASGLRERIIETVRDFRPASDDDWGCFLSGGTDSSSIVTILARQPGTRVRTCSIGFHEASYDELDFARQASEACGATPYLDYVDRSRALSLFDAMVDAYDQPFGNTSAIPTLACAELGRSNGFSVMLGGDGGDEIFGGNQRYAKDKVLEAFYRLPSPLKATARTVGNIVGRGNIHLLNRVRNFTQRGSLPNPDRFYTDDSFASDYYAGLLTPGFRKLVDRDASLEFMRGVYDVDRSGEPLHRIMRLDLLMAIAQNDLVKVHGACKHHGVVARFPYLDPDLVEYCGRLPAGYKVRGLQKRYLFKKAMAGILPEAILSKRKQGFGLPTAIWLKEDRATQDFVRDVLHDGRTRSRGWVEPDFVAGLVRQHMAGGWDYSSEIWHLMVLELWMRKYLDGR